MKFRIRRDYGDESNKWMLMVGHRGCIYPCSGQPVLHHEERETECAADGMPVFLACSECGYTPDPDIQPQLIERYLVGWLKFQRKLQKREGRGKYDWKS